MRLTLLIALLLGGLFNCGGPEVERYSWNQRMTVTVDTPDGPVSGSSVVEVNAAYCPEGCGLARDVEVAYGYRGEAVAVEVRPGRWLFALIGNPAQLMYGASPDAFGGIPRADRGRWLAMIPEQTEPVELIGPLRPTFVFFGDMDDPWTAIEVDPDNMASVLGVDVSLSSVTLEVTESPAELGRLADLLPSLGEAPENRLVHEVFPRNPSFAQSLQTGDFIRR